MKIATITFHRALNYGAILQCFALQKSIKDLGYDAEVLDYDCKIISKGYKLLRTDSKLSFVKSLILIPFYYKKRRNYKRFIEKYISVSQVHTVEELARVVVDYEAIITGSDQVWNYKLTGCDSAYFLDFVPEKQKRLSYAASFGIKDIPDSYRAFYQRHIDDMGYISVRERTGADLVKEISGREADVVLDPVFLQRAEEWKQIMPRTDDKGYIFVYMPGKNTLQIAQSLAKKKKLKIIYCAYDYSLRNLQKNVGDMRLSLGPDEFLSLLNGADYVVTGSFHATAFSLIFRKKFFVEVPPNVGSRITDLLDTFDLQERIFSGDSLPEDTNIQWEQVSQKMDELRQKSLMSLRYSIEAAVHD